MPHLTGFLLNGADGPLKLEFWDERTGLLLVEHEIHNPVLHYQYYFPEAHYVKRAEDLLVLTDRETDRLFEIIPRFGDREPVRMW